MFQRWSIWTSCPPDLPQTVLKLLKVEIWPAWVTMCVSSIPALWLNDRDSRETNLCLLCLKFLIPCQPQYYQDYAGTSMQEIISMISHKRTECVYPLKQLACFKKYLTYGIADILQNISKTRFFLAFVNHQWSASVVLHILCKSNTLCEYIPHFCAINWYSKLGGIQTK